MSGLDLAVMQYAATMDADTTCYRLRLAQIERENYPYLEQMLANIWNTVRRCHLRQEWRQVLAFYDALQQFLSSRGHWFYYFTLNTWATQAAEQVEDFIQVARFLHDRADQLQQEGKCAEAEILYRNSERQFLAFGEPMHALYSKHMRTLALRAQGKVTLAMQLNASVIATARKLGHEEWIVHPLYVRALFLRDQGNLIEAVDTMQIVLVGTHEPGLQAQAYQFLGGISLLRAQLHQARCYLEQALSINVTHGSLRRIATTHRLLGNVERDEEHFDEAQIHYTVALQLAQDIGDLPERGRVLVEEGKLRCRQGYCQQALPLFQSALSIYQEINYGRGITVVTYAMIFASLKCGRPDLAIKTVPMTMRYGIPYIWQYHHFHFLTWLRYTFRQRICSPDKNFIIAKSKE